MTIQSSLLSEIERHIKVIGMAETTFGKRAVNDGKLVSRLRSGANMTLSTLNKVRQYLDKNAVEAVQ